MLLHRLYSNATLRAAPLVLFALCAGCWEKIEYTGPDPSSMRPQATESSAAASGTESTQPAAAQTGSVPETPPVAVSPPEPVPSISPPAEPITPPVTSEATQPKSEVDRYATPAGESAATPPAPPTTVESGTSAPADEAASATPHTDATPVSATADVVPPSNAIDSRRAAWLLGSRLSLAALANDRGVATKNVPIWFGDARKAAKMLGASVLDLPEPAAAGKDAVASQQVISYLIASFRRIGQELSKQHGAEESNLFEMALTSNMLLLLYTPGTSEGIALTATISKTGPQTKLPAELWQPIVELVNKKAPQTDVRDAVRKMHIDADRILAERAEQNGR